MILAIPFQEVLQYALHCSVSNFQQIRVPLYEAKRGKVSFVNHTCKSHVQNKVLNTVITVIFVKIFLHNKPVALKPPPEAKEKQSVMKKLKSEAANNTKGSPEAKLMFLQRNTFLHQANS